MTYQESMQAQIALAERAVALDAFYLASVGSKARKAADAAIINAEADLVRLVHREPNRAELLRAIGR